MTTTHTQTDGPAIDVRDLSKSYGEVEAVRGVSFEVARGEVFCLLGPNGAGKTSIVEILEGYRTRTHGEVRVLGMDPARGERELHERVGIVLQESGVQNDLTVRELVEMYGRYHLRRRPVDEVIELVELGEKRDVRARQLSGGQKRRLDLALALVGEPDLIFLDEPTTGFDPARAAAGVVDDPVAVRPRQDGVPHHSLHGRGAASRQPGGGDERRSDHRHRAARGARRTRPAAGRDPLLAPGRIGRSAICPTSRASNGRSKAIACWS